MVKENLTLQANIVSPCNSSKDAPRCTDHQCKLLMLWVFCIRKSEYLCCSSWIESFFCSVSGFLFLPKVCSKRIELRASLKVAILSSLSVDSLAF